MKELSGPVWRRLASKDRFRYASALWRALSRAERGEYDARAVAIREDAQRLRENPVEDQWVLVEANGSAVAAEARTVADDPGVGVPRAEPMWRAHSDHSSTTPSAYPAADTTSYDAGVPLPGFQDYTTRWQLPPSQSSGHVDSAMPHVAGLSDTPHSPWPISQNVCAPFPDSMVSPARYCDRSLSWSTPVTQANSPMLGTDLLDAIESGRDFCQWTQPGMQSADNGMSWSAAQVMDLSNGSHYSTGQALSGADASSVDFCAGDSSGGAVQAWAILPANAQQEEFVAAEEWTAFINRLLVADENSAHAPSPISFAHETLGRCSPASQAVIELLAGTLRHGGGDSLYPTPSPSVGSPTKMAGDAFCEVGSPGLSAADAPSGSRIEHYEDPPLTPSTLVASPHEGWSKSTEPGSSGGDSTTAAPFMAMILEVASLASERYGATSTI
ncbi:uncharacterized protein TRAVEDRAFT_74290 [Trametes versicolor FP-101664 SS1]|uniref:uncharacterized protein n=1 Tax=Trametes versicolor (strain FP-101664) TaxID=717944 RepID=UPI0004621A33|nr:uncharacterized protein TRAVEDRAFT_74290 [Trametes versicolor FP-101664 SS1]EIW53963.1 hypothetical protein TRAVEDRAFT_74290 [Trametes versicolor FP-101664 SS1]